MEMEVVIPVNKMDFDFNSPHVSAPSTPKRFGEFYCSAPTSPTHLAQFYRDFDDFSNRASGVTSRVPFGSPKNEGDFAFDIGEESSEKESLSAEELFDGGVIKHLKTPSRLQASTGARIKGDYSPRHKKEADPFAISSQSATAEHSHRRGRERAPAAVLSSSSRRATRSLSPARDSDQNSRDQEEKKQQNTKILCSSSSSKCHRKWRLKDFFLFRSASEGRAADKDPLRKYTAGFRKSYEDAKNPNFRRMDSQDSGSNSSRRGKVSAHELHYTTNRAVSEDLKKKTFLPYKQGILGRLSFNPAAHALANGFGFSRK
ncbi:uncharacterized protein LOC111367439 [Olea europaea var. sylvestris]|uniref:uncharacterized protein LOC111367439 n=1 Tax=Olea europaea var. sylvestris TaxID=158386 RepID=UPI000C1D0684|nr:uncharacterized protein LOC111367439 [Olea europaea var. sylvestris]